MKRPLKNPKRYQPNRMPLGRRIVYFLFSLFAIGWAVHGLAGNDLLCSFQGRNPLHANKLTDYHFHGPAAWLMAASIICVAISFLTEVVDHYDKRNNESVYDRVGFFFLAAGIVFCALGAAAYKVWN
ncbi:MAG: hypothetical protein JNM63_06010 [Spirochaetia bacterium]|nr:hypothetical protein [Spirochaetia bacterium]